MNFGLYEICSDKDVKVTRSELSSLDVDLIFLVLDLIIWCIRRTLLSSASKTISVTARKNPSWDDFFVLIPRSRRQHFICLSFASALFRQIKCCLLLLGVRTKKSSQKGFLSRSGWWCSQSKCCFRSGAEAWANWDSGSNPADQGPTVQVCKTPAGLAWEQHIS